MKRGGPLNKHICEKKSNISNETAETVNILSYYKSMNTIICHSNQSSYPTRTNNPIIRSPLWNPGRDMLILFNNSFPRLIMSSERLIKSSELIIMSSERVNMSSEDLLSRRNDLLSCRNELLCRQNDLLCRDDDLLCHRNDLLTRRNDLFYVSVKDF